MTDIFNPSGVTEEISDKARRAVREFRKMQPMLSAYARLVTKRSDVQVVMSANSNGKTDGKKIYFRPPIELGNLTPHARSLCDKRGEDFKQLCPACAIREGVFVVIYHEIGHIAYGSFDQTTDEQKADLIERAVKEAGGKYSEAIKRKIDSVPAAKKNSYLTMAGLVSPFLPGIVNSLEDARINRGVFTARKGTKAMFDAYTRRTFTEGVEQKDATGQVVKIMWNTYPLNMQATVGLFVKASKHDYSEWFVPEVVAALDDPKITDLCNKVGTVRSVSGVYELSFPVLERMREFGFFKNENDPEPEPEPDQNEEPDDAQEPDPDSDTDPKGEASEEDGESEGDDAQGTDEEGDDPGAEGEDAPESDEAGEDEGSPSATGSDDESDEESGPDGGGDDQDSDDNDDADSDEPGDGADDDAEGSSEEGSGDQDGNDSEGSTGESGDSTTGDDPSGSGDQSDSSSNNNSEGELSDEDSDSAGEDGTTEEPRPEGEGDGSEGGGAGAPMDRDDERVEGDSDSEGEGTPDDLGEGEGVDSDDPLPEQDGPEQDDPDNGVESEPGKSGDELDGTEADGVDPQEGAGGDDAPEVDHVPERGDPAEETPSGGEGTPEEVERDDAGESTDEKDFLDTGADDGQGGVELREDSSFDTMPMGDPDECEKALHEFAHPEDKPDYVEEGKAVEGEMERAIIQGLYFETPSRNIFGVREHTYGTPYEVEGYDMSGGWDPDKYSGWGYSRKALGVEGDFLAPESILGPALLKMRVAFSDNQRGKNLNNRKSGKVNTRVLGKRAYHGDERIFKRRTLPGKKNYFVLIGVDISGSTIGENIILAKKAAFAQAQLCHRMGIKFAVYCHSANFHKPSSGRGEGMDLDMYHIKDADEPWTEQVQERLLNIGPDSANLDGHSMEYYRKVLDKRDETHRIILYYTDGKMPAENHDEELIILQREIKTCRRKNYTLIGVGIRTDSPIQHGLDTVQVDNEAEVIKVVNHLEKRLLEL